MARKPSKTSLKAPRPDIMVDGPDAAETDDLAPKLAEVVKGGWLVRIMVPHGAPAGDREQASRMAEDLAKTHAGAVYDPQQDAIVWPVPPPARSAAQVAAKKGPGPMALREPELQISWLVAGRPDSALALKWLSVVDAHFPIARPSRFGMYEPLQERLEKDPTGFAAAWDKQRAVDYGSGFFWKTGKKGLWGGVKMPEWRDRMPDGTAIARDGQPVTRIDLHVPVRIVATPGERQALAAFFAAAAEEMNAIFGAAWAKQEGTYSDGPNLGMFIPAPTPLRVERYGHWLGTNNEPAWLFWLGSALRTQHRVGPLIGNPETLGESPLPFTSPDRNYPQPKGPLRKVPAGKDEGPPAAQPAVAAGLLGRLKDRFQGKSGR